MWGGLRIPGGDLTRVHPTSPRGRAEGGLPLPGSTGYAAPRRPCVGTRFHGVHGWEAPPSSRSPRAEARLESVLSVSATWEEQSCMFAHKPVALSPEGASLSLPASPAASLPGGSSHVCLRASPTVPSTVRTTLVTGARGLRPELCFPSPPLAEPRERDPERRESASVAGGPPSGTNPGADTWPRAPAGSAPWSLIHSGGVGVSPQAGPPIPSDASHQLGCVDLGAPRGPALTRPGHPPVLRGGHCWGLFGVWVLSSGPQAAVRGHRASPQEMCSL